MTTSDNLHTGIINTEGNMKDVSVLILIGFTIFILFSTYLL